MARVLRITRVTTALLIIGALGWQFRWSTENSPTFTAGNFFSYFTVLSNVLLAVTFVAMAIQPALSQLLQFLTLRGIATLGIMVTGLVYAVLLAPVSADVDVSLRWVDFVVHTLAPLVGLVDWL
ncbi:MAG TPA: Pr6Pr family membrane protein, partial [Jiangellaceae bacterium]